MDQIQFRQNQNLSAEPSLRLKSRDKSVAVHGFHHKKTLYGKNLRASEVKFLNFVTEGKTEEIQRLLDKYGSGSSENRFNKNCTDVFERTALVLAIINRHLDAVILLLKAEVDLSDSLFYAIETEFTEAVEEILKSCKSQSIHLQMIITNEESVFPLYLSPIMLAAHKNNYEILDLLHRFGHILYDLSPYASNNWDKSRLRWLYYKARASPAYILLRYEKDKQDPVNESIELFGVLLCFASKERKAKYSDLADQCQEFAIALLDQLRTAQEVADLLRFRLKTEDDLGWSKNRPIDLVNNTLKLSSFNGYDLRAHVENIKNSVIASVSGSVIDETSISNNNQGGRKATNTSEIEMRTGHLISDITTKSNPLQASSSLPSLATLNNDVENQEDIDNNANAPKRKTVLGLPNNDYDARSHSNVSLSEYPEERKRTLGMRRARTTFIHNDEEMEFTRPKDFLKPIENAVEKGMCKLVTSENPQLALNYVKDGQIFGNSTGLKRSLKQILIGLFYPFISLAFYFFPSSKIGNIARNPTAKLCMHVASDIMLIILLMLSLILTDESSEIIFLVVGCWMLGKLFNIIFILYHQGFGTFFISIWNWNDIGSVIAYFTWAGLTIYAKVNEDTTRTGLSPLSIADIMEACVYMLVFLRPIEMLRVSRHYGPLEISMTKMLADGIQFSVVFVVVWFAFGTAITVLYKSYSVDTADNEKCDNSTTVGLPDGDDCILKINKFQNIIASMSTLFWSIFGYSDQYETFLEICCQNSSVVLPKLAGYLVFGLYHIGIVIVLVNMLIAIMSGTLQKTMDMSDQQWQFHRTVVWIRFIRTGFYRPPPMNLVPRPKEIYSFYQIACSALRKLFRNTCCKNDAAVGRPNSRSSNPEFQSTQLTEHQDQQDEINRYDIALQKVVKRYLKSTDLQSHVIQFTNV